MVQPSDWHTQHLQTLILNLKRDYETKLFFDLECLFTRQQFPVTSYIADDVFAMNSSLELYTNCW